MFQTGWNSIHAQEKLTFQEIYVDGASVCTVHRSVSIFIDCDWLLQVAVFTKVTLIIHPTLSVLCETSSHLTTNNHPQKRHLKPVNFSHYTFVGLRHWYHHLMLGVCIMWPKIEQDWRIIMLILFHNSICVASHFYLMDVSVRQKKTVN